MDQANRVKPDAGDGLQKEFQRRAVEFAQMIADQYRESLAAGEQPRLQDFLAICPNEEIRDKVRQLCGFERLMEAALGDISHTGQVGMLLSQN